MPSKTIFKDWNIVFLERVIAICLSLCIMQGQENWKLKFELILISIQVHFSSFPHCYLKKQVHSNQPC